MDVRSITAGDDSDGPFPAGGGQLGALIRRFDWSKTSLGPFSRWPQSLKTVTSMLLLSPVPIVLLWGPDGVMIYNDAYSVFAGGRHPQLLGSKVREGWLEVADFNNILAGVQGSLDLMKIRIAQGRAGEIDRYMKAAQSSIRRAAALTHRLLAFSRRQTLDPRPNNVFSMEELIRRSFGPEIAVESVAHPDLWNVLVDAGQLENGLLNLCLNARDAMVGGGKLTIETGNKELDEHAARQLDLPAGPYVTLCIVDTGVGMAPEVVAHAFDPFFTTKPIGQGTGLGLSMIYGFVRQSGGQIKIDSEPEKGATVCIYLPRSQAEPTAADPEADPSEAPVGTGAQTVLVVDDEPLLRVFVTEVLEDLGYSALEAGEGAGAMRILESGRAIDLLITDVGLPNGMNGRQLADAARQARPGLKVLFITGYAESALMDQLRLEPGLHVITKPFATEALAKKVGELIAGA